MLARVAGLFARRGLQHLRLAVAPTDDERFSRHHDRRRRRVGTARADREAAVQADQRREDHRARSPGVGRARAAAGHRVGRAATSAVRSSSWCRCSAVGSSPSARTRSRSALEGAPDKVDDFEELLRPYGIVELQRTGRVALPRLDRRPEPASHESPERLNERQTDGQRVLREGRRLLAHRQPQGGDRRVRLAGPRPRAQPEGLGRRRARRSAGGLVVEGEGRGGRVCGWCRSTRPPPRPTSS